MPEREEWNMDELNKQAAERRKSATEAAGRAVINALDNGELSPDAPAEQWHQIEAEGARSAAASRRLGRPIKIVVRQKPS